MDPGRLIMSMVLGFIVAFDDAVLLMPALVRAAPRQPCSLPDGLNGLASRTMLQSFGAMALLAFATGRHGVVANTLAAKGGLCGF